MELEQALREFVNHYNYHRYHESLNNATPADKYYGKAERTLESRRKIKLQTIRQRKINYFKTSNLSFNGNKSTQRINN
jgi:putative transposase